MSDTSEEAVRITPTYAAVGISGVSWVPVQSGLFEYPLAEGAKPALLGSCCNKCARNYFPSRALCPDCFDEGEMQSKRFDTEGVIYSSTVVRVPSPAGIKPPYAYGYVDITADKIRLHALLDSTDPASIAPGTKVELDIGPIAVNKQGQQVIGYKFKPIA